MDLNQSLAQKHDILRQRALLNHNIRQFFFARNVLEVETPVFSDAGNSDPAIHSLIADFSPPGLSYSELRYAHTSPEFPMKRLITEGAGSIYQICKVFRVGELGRFHNPEFTMLEWYRLNFSYEQLMQEVSELLLALNFGNKCEKISYVEVFKRYLEVDITTATLCDLKYCAQKNGLEVVGLGDIVDEWLNLLLSHLIEPKLGINKPIFVYDFPASQAALARIREEDFPVAERFELYIDGVEIGNGYQELLCPNEYVDRFDRDNQRRQRLGLPVIKLDKRFLEAMKQGLPPCSGIAVGLDRLLMASLKINDIRRVLSFDFLNA